mmetsp:Transcript_7462/g.24911  ORF Transcript_7462/g.24911 Transcript_7462/m.24911 type:complete len:216 (+) Transcript_7462:974-1621(+)
MEFRFSWYSSRGQPCIFSMKDPSATASLAPKHTVTNTGGVGSFVGNTFRNKATASRLLYPLYPRKITSACRLYLSANAPPNPPSPKLCSVMESPKSTILGRLPGTWSWPWPFRSCAPPLSGLIKSLRGWYPSSDTCFLPTALCCSCTLKHGLQNLRNPSLFSPFRRFTVYRCGSLSQQPPSGLRVPEHPAQPIHRQNASITTRLRSETPRNDASA